MMTLPSALSYDTDVKLVDQLPTEPVAVFAAASPRLAGIARRMLRGRHDAEDIVQETWLRWQRCDRSKVANAPAFLAVITTRLAINAGRTARARYETRAEPWFPEAVDTTEDSEHRIERAESVESAILLLSERLSPTELAAYVLREAFDYPYARIAEIIEIQEANIRQIVSRARRRVVSEPRRQVRADEHHRLVAAFLNAARNGEFADLEALLRRSRMRGRCYRTSQPRSR